MLKDPELKKNIMLLRNGKKTGVYLEKKVWDESS